MKKFILAVVFTLGFIGIHAQDVEWYTDMNKAMLGF